MLAEIIFLILALIILVAAFKMLAATEPVHAAVYLGVVLGGVAGIFLTLGAELLAAVQILIYVGAVVTLILFAVMLTTHASPTEGFAEDRTPLSVLGIEDAPRGMDVESLTEVPEDVTSVSEAEAAADAAAETEEGETVQPGDEDEAPEEGEEDQPPEDVTGTDEADADEPTDGEAADETDDDERPDEEGEAEEAGADQPADTEPSEEQPSADEAPDEPGTDDEPSEETSPSEDERSEDEEDR